MCHSALLAWRFPPGFNLCRPVRLPLLAGSGGDTAQLGERGLGADPFRVVTNRDQDRRGDIGADAVDVQQVGCDLFDESADQHIELVDLDRQRLGSAGQGQRCGLGRVADAVTIQAWSQASALRGEFFAGQLGVTLSQVIGAVNIRWRNWTIAAIRACFAERFAPSNTRNASVLPVLVLAVANARPAITARAASIASRSSSLPLR